MKASPWRILVVFLVAGFLAVAVFVFFAAAGHGTYVPAMVLFPYTMLSTYFFDEMTDLFVIVLLLQFPAYGTILAFAQYKKKLRATGIVLLATHLLAAGAALAFTSQSFL
jgi:hypothetical protein